MKRYLMKILFWLITTVPCVMYAQTKVQVVSKIISKEYAYDGQSKITIKGEKSDISIIGGNYSTMKVEILLISKCTDKETALNDLKFINYSIQQKDKEIIMSNNFISPDIKNIKSNLSVRYIISVPEKCNLQITNLYGNIELKNLSITGEINNSFGDISMKDIKGAFSVHLYYSNIFAAGINAILKCKSENSDQVFENVSGTYDLITSYGKINFTANNDLRKIDINASRSTVEVQVDNFEKYNYSLAAMDDEIILPDAFKNMIKKEFGLKKFDHVSNSNFTIKVKTTYCPITIKTK
jgi:hypothetical protein